MNTDIKFLDIDDVIEIHRLLIQKSPFLDESDAVLDYGLLESAIAQPKQTFSGELLHPTIYDQAAAYLFGLIKNHAFENGNKRTALAITIAFLKINGYRIALSKRDTEQLVMDAATGIKNKDEIALTFREGGVVPIKK